jgi:lysyl-tRNA synthetase, class II
MANLGQQYFEIRSKKIMALKESRDPTPYPHKFQINTNLREFAEKYKGLQKGETLEDTEIRVGVRM